MKCIEDIYEAIAENGFTESTLHVIDELVKQIENGSTDLPRFNLREHSGICKAGSALIGVSIVASYVKVRRPSLFEGRLLLILGGAFVFFSYFCALFCKISNRNEQ